MDVKFSNNGVRHVLIVAVPGRRESEVTPEIKPDLTLWTSAMRKTAGLTVGHDGKRVKAHAAARQPKCILLPGTPAFKDREYALG